MDALGIVVGKLPYENKLFTVRKIVDKVIATKEKVQICGTIPVFEPIKESHIGLHANDRHSYEINQPFEITFTLPRPDDKRTHGYSPKCIKELKAALNRFKESKQSLVMI